MRRPASIASAVLLLGCLPAAAQNDAGDSFCVLPLWDQFFQQGTVSDAAAQVQIDKLKAQLGASRTYLKTGFAGIYGGPTALNRCCTLAQANNIVLGPVIALQTHNVNSTIASVALTDFRLYQWRLDGVTWQGQTDSGGNPIYPDRDYRVVTPSRLATALQNTYKSQVQQQAGEIQAKRVAFPNRIAAVSIAIEEELATGGQSADSQLADYSPFAVTEFRDWLLHNGIYDDLTGTRAGEGAPEAIVGTFQFLAGAWRPQFYDDPTPADANGTGASFNAVFGTAFTTWALRYWDLAAFPAKITSTAFDPTPESGSGFTAGGFDAPRVRSAANVFWKAWSWDVADQGGAYPPGYPGNAAFGFRQAMVRHFTNDLLEWSAEKGLPRDILYAHQIATEFGASGARARSSASPSWTGSYENGGTLGVTIFNTIFSRNAAQQLSRNWGIFEWHPKTGSTATNTQRYDATLAHLNSYYWDGCHALFPISWTDTGTFPVADSGVADGIRDFLAARPDEPPPAAGSGNGLRGDYFTNVTLTGAPAATRFDPFIDFTWNGAAPVAGVGGTNFSVRWTGWVQARYTEATTFHAKTDDGVRLWVGGQLLVDNWVTQGAIEKSGTLNTVAGQLYPVVIEYFQGTGGASAQFSWSSARQVKQPVGQSQLYSQNTWTNQRPNGTTPWSKRGNWSSGKAPEAAAPSVAFFAGVPFTGNSIVIRNDIAPAANVLALGGSGPAAGNPTVTLTGDAPLALRTIGTQAPSIALDATRTGTSAFTYDLTTALEFADTVTAAGDGSAAFKLGGGASGTGGLTKDGTSMLRVTGATTFTGPTRVQSGRLALEHLSALGGSSGVTVDAGASLQPNLASGTYAAIPATLTGAGTAGQYQGALYFNQGGIANPVWPGAIALAGDATIMSFGVNYNTVLSGPIGGAGNLTLGGRGGGSTSHTTSYTLNAASDFTGATTIANLDGIKEITVKLGTANALPVTTSLTLNTIGGTAGQLATLDLNGKNQQLAGLAATGTASGTKRVINSTTTAATLKLETPAGNQTFAGLLSGAALSLEKSGPGVFTLTGASTFAGRTTLSGGTLSLGGAANPLVNSTPVDITAGTLDVSGLAGSFTIGSGKSLRGAGAVNGAVTIAGNHRPWRGLGIQSITGALVYQAGASLGWELGADTTAGPGIDFSQVQCAATVTAASAAVALFTEAGSVNFSSAFWQQPRTWTILSATGISGNFTLAAGATDAGGRSASSYGDFALQVVDGNRLDLVWTPNEATLLAAWRTLYFGAEAGNPNISGDNADPDGDGDDNRTEYRAGTDPTNALDRFAIVSLAMNGNAATVKIDGKAGRGYVLQVSPDLAAWTDVPGSGATGAGGELTLTDPTAPAAPAFYRVRLLGP